MRYPDFLKDNGTIGFVAPSFGASIEPYRAQFDHAQEKLKALGFALQLGPNCYAGEGLGISNTPEKCGEELTEYYCRSDNDVLISCGGGEMMCEILDYVDFEKIKNAPPKWYMGYSDNTNFTFLLTTLCDTASVYGPCISHFGMDPWHKQMDYSLGLLQGKSANGRTMVETIYDMQYSGNGVSAEPYPTFPSIELQGYDAWEKESLKSAEQPFLPFHVTEPSVLHLYKGNGEKMSASTVEEESIVMEGRLLGGCLDCLVNLAGTKYDQVSQYIEKYKNDGILWFLEACDLNVMSIRRAMWELDHAGWFKYTRGFIIGRPLNFGQELMGCNQYNAVYDMVSHYKVPILMDADVGHLAPMVPLICGSMAKVKAKDNVWTVKMTLR